MVYHMDPYRLKQRGKMAELVDFDSAFRDGICLIEWPNRLGKSLYNEETPGRLEVMLEGTGPGGQGRRARLRATASKRWSTAVRVWLAAGRMPDLPPLLPSSARTMGPPRTGAEQASWPPLHGIPADWRVLGIETSCDDTAAAVLTGDGRVLSNVLASQAEIHGEWGGVKPDAAQAAHQENIDHVVDAALRHAGVNAEDLMGIAATVGPGLSLCLQVSSECTERGANEATGFSPSAGRETWH